MYLPHNRDQSSTPIKALINVLLNGEETAFPLAESGSFLDGKERYDWKTPDEIYDAYNQFFASQVTEISGFLGQPDSFSQNTYVWNTGDKNISLHIDQGDKDLPIYVYVQLT